MGTDLMGHSVEHLKGRVVLGSMLIRMLEGEDDARAPAAIERLRARQREINAVLVAKMAQERAERGEAEPEPVMVGLRAVRLRGEIPTRMAPAVPGIVAARMQTFLESLVTGYAGLAALSAKSSEDTYGDGR